MKRSTRALLGCLLGVSSLVPGCMFEYSEFDFVAEGPEPEPEPEPEPTNDDENVDAGVDSERRDFSVERVDPE